MIRCNNCGFENPENTNNCSQCSSKLVGENTPAPPPPGNKKTQMGRPVQGVYLDKSSNSPTKRDAPKTPESEILVECQRCSYPLTGGDTTCPNCGYDNVKKGDLPQVIDPPKKDAAPPAKKTVNLSQLNFEEEKPTPEFILESVDGKKAGNFEISEEGKVVLNRENLDEKNPSISSGQHFEISFHDGEWAIEDLSSNQATFIQIDKKMPIKDDTIIIVGNKILRFKIK